MKNYEFKRKDGTVKLYHRRTVFSEGFAAIQEDEKGKWCFIDEEGNEICPKKYEFPVTMRNPNYNPKEEGSSLFLEQPFFFSEGYVGVGIAVGDYLKFAFLNSQGQEMCPFIYTAVCDFVNGLAIVRDENFKWLVINKKFKQITKRTYDRIHNFHFGYAIVELNGMFGFINSDGEEMCEIKYSYMSCFNENGIAQINLPNATFDRTYWIDTQGKTYYMFFDSNEMHPIT